MAGNTGLLPETNMPGVIIDDRIGPDSIHLTVRIGDLNRFLERLSTLGYGEPVNLIKHGSSRIIQIRFVGDNSLGSKTLEEL